MLWGRASIDFAQVTYLISIASSGVLYLAEVTCRGDSCPPYVCQFVACVACHLT